MDGEDDDCSWFSIFRLKGRMGTFGIDALLCLHTSNAAWEGWHCISFPLFLMNFNLPGTLQSTARIFELKNGSGRNHQVKPDPPSVCISNRISKSLTRPTI